MNVKHGSSKFSFAIIYNGETFGVWNDYLWPTMVLNDDSLMPIQAALTTIQSIEGVTTGQIMASLVTTSIPIFVVYVLAQKYIVKGFSGGLKL